MAPRKNTTTSVQDDADTQTQQPDAVPVVPKIGGAQAKPLDPKDLIPEGERGVLMNFPKAVRITLPDHRVVAFKPGQRRVPLSLAKMPMVDMHTGQPILDKDTGDQKIGMHWYLAVNGVEDLEEDA